ncbi:MAG: glycoside hydrolase family 95 protein, partial [Clostridia bacterium]|nr:glycoside hydrolase family 95 protein [Clostridia bacterium]
MQRLFYLKPAATWNEALPLGNGRMGAMIFGGTAVDRICLNEDSLWYGGFRDRVNPDARENLPRIREMLREGRISEAQILAEAALTGTPDGERHYEPLCDLIIQQLGCEPLAGMHGMRSLDRRDMEKMEVPVDSYMRSLDLMEGIHRVTYEHQGRKLSREAFISYPHQVMALHMKGYPCRVMLRRSCYQTAIEKVDDTTIAIRGRTGDGGVAYACLCRAVGDGVHVIGNTLYTGEEATLYVAGATTFRVEDPVRDALTRIRAAQAAGYEEVRRQHLEDFTPRMEACTLELEEMASEEECPTDMQLRRFSDRGTPLSLISTYFTFGRYLLLSSSREGSLPANLQGIWNASFNPPWDSKYTININTEMNYWPAETLNLPEEHLPLFDHLLRMLPHGREVARDMYGARGFVAHHNTDIWGDCAPQDTYLPATYWQMGAAWLCLHIAEHYRFTGDRAFLEKFHPVMEEAALFFEDTLVCRPDGTLSVSPSCSPENTYIAPSGEHGNLTDCAAMDSQILHALVEDLEEMGRVLGKKTERYACLRTR